jgi:hypothetical protein
LGSGTPEGRVPLIRPRRDRIMGSSILASLSEAGGNDPLHPASRPLPPHLPDVADRVGTRPTPPLVQLHCLFPTLLRRSPRLHFQEFMPWYFHRRIHGKCRFGIPIPLRPPPPFVLSFAHNSQLALFTASLCFIMFVGFLNYAQIIPGADRCCSRTRFSRHRHSSRTR